MINSAPCNQSIEISSAKKTRETIAMQHTFNTPLIALIRDSRGFMKIVTAIKLFFFLSTFYFVPGAQAVEQAVEAEQAKSQFHPQGRNDEEKLSNTLQAIKEHVAERKSHLSKRVSEESSLWEDFLNLFGASDLLGEDLDRLQSMAEAAEQLHRKNLAGFVEIERDLQAKGLPEAILQRHAETVNKYQEQYRQFQGKLGQALQAESLQDQDASLGELDEFLDEQQFKRRQQPIDPDNLPFGAPDSKKTREPVTDPQQLNELLGLNHRPGTLENIIDGMIAPAYAQPGNQPTPADLESTVDAQITEAIRAKADELNNDPVQIYNWVRNNIEFIPSYGSIQGSDYTLQHGKGNAFDTASLLIALLRAANVPARYAYGTVEIPADKVMNWIGGAEVPEAAQQILGQGGIPNVALVNGGKITDIRIEQVWVEAWVDYQPSRAAKHIVGDSWIPLDASFKQYEFIEGENLQNEVPFDAPGLVDQISQTADINEQEGYVQGLGQVEIETTFANYQQQVESYINAQNPDATVGEVYGLQKIIIQDFQQLQSGLPYKLRARTNGYSQLPDNLRHKFRYTLGSQHFGTESGRLITFEKSLPELAGKRLALSFRPASQADEDLINGYIPAPDPNTGEIDISLLPRTLPGYLLNLTAEFTQDGEVVGSASAGTMGSELYETLALWSPSFGWDQAVNHPVSGEYRAIGLDLQGVNPGEVAQLQADVEATRAILNSGDETQMAALTKSEVIGDMLFSAVYSYFALNNMQDQLQARLAKMINYRLPSYGLFSTSLQPSYWFGLPRNVNLAGLVIDVDRLAVQCVAKDNDRDRRVDFIRAVGVRASAMEHLVPERMFSTSENPAQGISAVKALAIASAEGQRIWTIDQGNLSQALSAISLSPEIESEIRNAVLAGKVATTHDRPVNFAGGTNTGYILIDPETGAGAYLIAGGENGGFLVALVITILAVLASLALISGGFVVAGIALFLWEIINFFFWIDAINNASNANEFNQANMGQALVGLLGLLLIPGIGAQAIIVLLFGIAFSWMLVNSF